MDSIQEINNKIDDMRKAEQMRYIYGLVGILESTKTMRINLSAPSADQRPCIITMPYSSQDNLPTNYARLGILCTITDEAMKRHHENSKESSKDYSIRIIIKVDDYGEMGIYGKLRATGLREKSPKLTMALMDAEKEFWQVIGGETKRIVNSLFNGEMLWLWDIARYESMISGYEMVANIAEFSDKLQLLSRKPGVSGKKISEHLLEAIIHENRRGTPFFRKHKIAGF